MLKLDNCGPIEYRKMSQINKVYLFGAGRALESCLDIYHENKDIEAIVDNNDRMWGNSVKHNGRDVEIISPKKFVERIKGEISRSILMITSPFYSAEIVNQLDIIPELDGLRTFLQIIVRNTKEAGTDFVFSSGSMIIPKKIHYIWVGGKELPEEFKKNIQTWKKYNPDYEIIEWNENNYDCKKCDYSREAIESKAFAFFPNFARLDIIYNEGGIYLDTDVEALRSFDDLLCDKAFFNMGCADRINHGCGFGAAAHSEIIGALRDKFAQSHFLNENGKPGNVPCHQFVHPEMKKRGFLLENRYQKIDGVVVYPNEVMSPLTIPGMPDCFSDKTVSVHKEAGAWKSDREKEGMQKLEELYKERIR